MAAAAPTIDDARAAGRALTAVGAREVMVFGSVARGVAVPYSDIDLVAILDDVDYKQRWQTQLAWQRLAATPPTMATTRPGRLVHLDQRRHAELSEVGRAERDTYVVAEAHDGTLVLTPAPGWTDDRLELLDVTT